MKYSQYNHFVEMENVVLCFNAYNYSRLLVMRYYSLNYSYIFDI